MEDKMRRYFNFPTQSALLDMWMAKYFSHQFCVVFHQPFKCVEKLFPLFPYSGNDIINSEYAILIMDTEKEVLDLCHSWPEEDCYATAWVKGAMVSENT